VKLGLGASLASGDSGRVEGEEKGADGVEYAESQTTSRALVAAAAATVLVASATLEMARVSCASLRRRGRRRAASHARHGEHWSSSTVRSEWRGCVKDSVRFLKSTLFCPREFVVFALNIQIRSHFLYI
jgi:hypothetical protein